MNESISAGQEERNAGKSAGMDIDEIAFDDFDVPEPKDDYGEGMVEHDTEGDVMERLEWIERAVGHTPAEGV